MDDEMLQDLLPIKFLLNRKIKTEHFINANDHFNLRKKAKCDIKNDLHLRCDVEYLDLLYVIKGNMLNVEKQKNGDEIHVFCAKVKRVDISSKDRDILLFSVQRKILYPTIIIFNFEDEVFEIAFSVMHKGVKKTITIVDKTMRSGWIDYERLKTIFGEIKNVLLGKYDCFDDIVKKIQVIIYEHENPASVFLYRDDYEIKFVNLWSEFIKENEEYDFNEIKDEICYDCDDVFDQLELISSIVGYEAFYKFRKYLKKYLDDFDDDYSEWLKEKINSFEKNLDCFTSKV